MLLQIIVERRELYKRNEFRRLGVSYDQNQHKFKIVQILSQLRLVRVIDLSPSLFKPLVLLLQINLQWQGRNTQHGRGQQSANAHSCD